MRDRSENRMPGGAAPSPSPSPPGVLLNIDKPAGWTSRDVVNRIVRLTKTKRVGHAGTLDPLATGVLVVALGTATRLIEYVQQLPKTYRAKIRLGATSNTDDREGEVRETAAPAPSEQAIRAALALFQGTILQTPPAFSAIKIAGQAAYQMARRGESARLAPRNVTIHRIDVLQVAYPTLCCEITCGSGTYIRSIARDLGQMLGVGGLLMELRRLAIGRFHVESAATLEQLEEGRWARFAIDPAQAVVALPHLFLDDERLTRLLRGQALPWELEELGPEDRSEKAVSCAILDLQGRLRAIARFDPTTQLLHPEKAGFV